MIELLQRQAGLSGQDPVDESVSLTSIGVDSLALPTLVESVQEQFGLFIFDEDLGQIWEVKDLLRAVATAQDRTPAAPLDH